MNVKELLKNLWTIPGLFPGPGTVHSENRVSPQTVPVQNRRQAVERATFSGVLPLRGVSY